MNAAQNGAAPRHVAEPAKRLRTATDRVVGASIGITRLALTAGEAHDNRLAAKLMSRLKSGAMLLADRGYDADWIRALAGQHGAWANIPPRRNRNDALCFSPYLYRARNLIERFFNKIKQCRRVATRYDKLAANYLAFIQLAAIRLWLRANESTPQFSFVRDNLEAPARPASGTEPGGRCGVGQLVMTGRPAGRGQVPARRKNSTRRVGALPK